MDIIRQIEEHPEMKQQREQHEAELAIRDERIAELEGDRDEWQEKAEGADDVAFEDRKFLDEVNYKTNPATGELEHRKITLSDLQTALSERRKPRWSGEYSVLDELNELLEWIIPEKTVTKTVVEIEVKEKEVLPDVIHIEGIPYQQNVNIE